ncbi:organic cation transporter protein-like [Centruroides sculpturatus]|uniref:organic cation transporter protein-like n=1 Tax=Centruroides sculpturatus TaxID=218467 RepID=UPI000C6CF06A|nr:organic cation transporter protein-like [Centruroides sculpturatus]
MNISSDNVYSHNKEEKSEDITDVIGHWGKWQLILMISVVYINIPAAWYNLGMAFLAPNVDHWCAKPPEFSNMSTDEWKNYSIPIVINNNKQSYSKCEMYSSIEKENRTRIPCKSWDYDHSFYRSTIVEKWDLVCEKSWLSSLAQSFYFFGFLVTVFVGGQLSDKFGRKPILYLCIIWTFVFGVICTFSENFWLFAICRFFLALGRASTFLIVYVLLMEVVGKEYRVIVGLFDKLGWAVGQMILPGLVWLLRDWFYQELVSFLPYIIILPLWWITPESPRWLLSKGRVDEAEKIVKKAIKTNKRNIENLNEKLKSISEKIVKESEGKDNKQVTFLDVMKCPNLRRLTLILYIVWISNVLAYYGLSFSADDIGVNILLFFFLSALVEIPAGFFYFFIQRFIGRRYTQIASMLVTGLTCLIAIAIPEDIPIAITALAVISKFGLSVSFTSMYLLSSEIYPTVVRNVGLGSCSMMGRVGAVIAPFMKEAGNDVHRALPLGLFGSISLIGAALVLFLPETKDSELTDTLAQGEVIGSHTRHILRRKSENEVQIELKRNKE